MLGTSPGFRSTFHFRLLHRPDGSIYCWCSQHDLASLQEMTIFYYDQRNLILIVTRHVLYLNSEHHIAQGSVIFPPNPLSGMRPLCPLKSWIKPTSRPLSRTNSGVTKFTLAPLSIKQVVSTPSKMAVPRLALLSHWFLGSSFQNAEGVNCGLASFRPWPYPSGGAGLPWSRLPRPGLTPASYG